MWEAFAKAQVEREMKERTGTLIGALYANTNMDDAKADRPGIVRRLEDDLTYAIEQLWLTEEERLKKEHELAENPFFKGMKPIHTMVDQEQKIAPSDEEHQAGEYLGLTDE